MYIIKVCEKQVKKLGPGKHACGNLRAVFLTTDGTQRAMETNIYLKINWESHTESLVTRFAKKSEYTRASGVLIHW